VSLVGLCCRRKLVVVVALLAVLAVTSAYPFTNCGTSSDLIKVNTLDMSPNPPVKGQQLKVTQTGTSSIPLNGGTVSVKGAWCWSHCAYAFVFVFICVSMRF
jgi:hypothetical protein